MLYLLFPNFPATFRKIPISGNGVLEQAFKRAGAALYSILKSKLGALGDITPGCLHDLEQELHQVVARECIDPVVGTLLQTAHEFCGLADRVTAKLATEPFLRLQVRSQPVKVTLLGGSQITVSTPYYLRRPPRGPGRPRGRGKRGAAGNGTYPVLEAMGIHYRVSPALGSEIGRSVALGTVDQAQLILSLRGIKLDRKVVRRLALRLAERALAYKEWAVEKTAAGFRGDLCKGKRIVMSTDGGRIRTRKSKRGRKLKSGRHRFDAIWREPKVFVIYEIDAQGNRVRKGLLRYDATMQAADGLFQQLEAVLKEIGADQADEWIVVADGAEWIWNRVNKLVAALKYDSDKVTQIVDLYHAVQHIHLIAGEVRRWSDAQRKEWVKKMRGHLLDGHLERVEAAVEGLCRGRKAKRIRKLLPYLTENAHRLQYSDFRRQRVPIGSGAVESCVRRVINLRLKGNGIFWTVEVAEGILHLRAQMLSGRWEQFVKNVMQPRINWTLGQERMAA